MNRDAAISELSAQDAPYDIIVIGGGATGLGAAVDAASRGHRTLLVEQSDFSKGTSSRSTKLVHGGVRYLRQGNLSLVQEALRERGLLYRNAPHLVNDMAFVIPNYKWWEGPFYGVGMKVYDGLAGRLGLKPSRWLSKEETLERIPTIETDGLTGGVVYYDGQFDDSRLAITLAQTAVAHGAAVLNYVRCIGFIKVNQQVAGILAEDLETGSQYEIRGKAVINATGVFADSLRTQDDPAAKPIIAVSQGVHLVLPKSFLPGDAAIMIPKTSDGRVLFAVPWHDRVVLGTTDTSLPRHDLEPRALDEERDYLMEHAARYLTKDPSPQDVLSIFAGLRPLVRSGDATDTAALARDHSILISSSKLISIVGGKWTTYRKMGEDVIDQAETVAGLTPRPCLTRELPLSGCLQTGDGETTPLTVYGTAAEEIRERINSDPSLAVPLHDSLPYLAAEVSHHIENEMARTIEDVLARRTRSLFLNATASREAAPRVAAIMAKLLGRDAAWQAAQVAEFQELADGYIFTNPASRTAQ